MKLFTTLKPMDVFQFGRAEGFPSQYCTHPSSATIDMTVTILIAIFAIIFLGYLSIIPSYRKKEVSTAKVTLYAYINNIHFHYLII